MAASRTSVIGAPLSRVDGPLKVTGQAQYAAEFRPPDLAYAALVESAIPAGRIAAIDVADATASPGVLLVLTHENADRLAYRQASERPAVDPVSGEQLHVLQDDRVRFVGEPVAVVVARTFEEAAHAATLVRVSYERAPDPALTFDPGRAQPASAAAAKRGRGPETVTGDPDAALAAAPVTVAGHYVQPREQHHPMEPHATIAQWQEGRLTLWSKTQWVGNERDAIAHVFGIDPRQVRVINPFVGGAFGSGLRTWPHVTLAAMAARRAGRPVKLVLTRRQVSRHVGFRPRVEQEVRLGAEHDGRLLALTQDAVAQTSTYEEFAEPTLTVPNTTYTAATRRTRYALVPMNTGTPCPMRGPGWATGLIAQEIAMDELAVRLSMDPIALRLRNFAERDPAKDLPWSSNRLRECYAIGAERFGWARRPLAPAMLRDGHELVGWGMATAVYHAGRYPTSASATVLADGSAVVRCATSDMGPGTYTAMVQVAADALDLPPARIRAELGDSDLPPAKEHGGSTTLASVGAAVRAACKALNAKRAARRDGLPGELTATASSAPGDEAKTVSPLGFGAVFVEVRVDEHSCFPRVSRIVGAYDAGRIVNPRLARSQVIGGMVGGIGMALMEEAVWDERLGRVVNPDLAEYHVPVHADIGDLEAIFVPGEDLAVGPLGSKGVAELGLCGVAPAIANAIWHATGKRLRELPITLDKILMA